MSQFAFGDIIISRHLDTEKAPLLPCSCITAFHLEFKGCKKNGYFRTAPKEYDIVPFTITDSPMDNTAELLLNPDGCHICGEELYPELAEMNVAAKTLLLASELENAAKFLGSKEFILNLSDGYEIGAKYIHCKINELAFLLNQIISLNNLFITESFWVKLD